MNYDKFVMGLVSPESMKTEKDKRLTAALGLVGEAIEFDGSIDEAGDCLWYLTFASNLLGLDWQCFYNPVWEVTENRNPLTWALYVGDTGLFSEYIKKTTYHGKEYDKQRAVELLTLCWRSFAQMLKAYNLKLTDVMDFNIKKLEHRYPEGFNV